jgi:hypothetical protein
MCLQALRGLIEGLMTAHDRRLSLDFGGERPRAWSAAMDHHAETALPRPTTDAFQRKTFTTPARRDPRFPALAAAAPQVAPKKIEHHGVGIVRRSDDVVIQNKLAKRRR